ncbi:TPA: hypothetical protein ACX6Q4_002570 [Photobacterium damselae]
MKKIIIASVIAISFSTNSQAGYLDYGYVSESEMSEDVSLLAQASLLYKTGGERKALESTQRICKGIEIKYDKTSSPTPNMKRWKRKVDGICSDY